MDRHMWWQVDEFYEAVLCVKSPVMLNAGWGTDKDG